MAITLSTLYSVSVPNATAASAEWEITGIDVPSLATGCLIFIDGYLTNGGTEDVLDISNFDEDSDDHFTHLVTTEDLNNSNAAVYYLRYGDTGFPTRGSTGLTFTGSFTRSVSYGICRVNLVFISGSVTDGTFIVDSDSQSEAYAGSDWTASLTGVSVNDLAFIIATNYNGAVGNPSGEGQSVLDDGSNGSINWGIYYETGEGAPSIELTWNYGGAIAFAINADDTTTTAPTTLAPTTVAPTTLASTTIAPTTAPPTTLAPTTAPPTTLAPTTLSPTTLAPTTLPPTTLPPTTLAPTTVAPTTVAPTTLAPTTLAPTTEAPTTSPPTTLAPTTLPPTTLAPTTLPPTTLPPTTEAPTTLAPTTLAPTTTAPTTLSPTTTAPTTIAPTTEAPTTLAPTTSEPTTAGPTTLAPTTAAPAEPMSDVTLKSVITDEYNLKSVITDEVILDGNIR